MLCSCIPVGLIFRLHLEFSVFLVLYWFEQSSDSCTAAVKSLHPNMCIAVHCSILLHPQLPWYRESADHWELRDQV